MLFRSQRTIPSQSRNKFKPVTSRRPVNKVNKVKKGNIINKGMCMTQRVRAEEMKGKWSVTD